MSDIATIPPATGVNITALTRFRHAELLAAARAMGGQTQLAEHLGIDRNRLSHWITLRNCPPLKFSRKWTKQLRNSIEEKLLELTGKTLGELFPPPLRSAIRYFREHQNSEQTEAIPDEVLIGYANHRTEELAASASDPDETDRLLDLQSILPRALKQLSNQQREVLKLRFGLGGERGHSLGEVAGVLKVSRERVRQIEMRALRKLEAASYQNGLARLLPDERVKGTEA